MTVVFLMFLAPLIICGISDLKPDLKSGGVRLAVIYIAIATVSVILCVCVLRGVDLKSPSDIVESVLSSILPPLK